MNLARAVRPFRVNDALGVCLWGWIKWEVYKGKVDTRDRVLARILDAAAHINKREDQPRQTTNDVRTRGAKCTEVYDEIFKLLLSTVKKNLISV